MKPAPTMAGAGVLLLVLAVGAANQIDNSFTWRHHDCDLRRPGSCLVDPGVVEESPYGLLQWVGPSPLEFEIPDGVEQGSVVKLALRTSAGRVDLRLLVGVTRVATITVEDRWQRYELVTTASGRPLALDRVDPISGPIHVSRVSVANTVGYSRDGIEAYILHDSVPRESRRLASAAVGVALTVAMLALIAAWRRRGGEDSWIESLARADVLLLPSAAVVTALQAMSALSPHRVVYPATTFLLLLALPVVTVELIRNRRRIASTLRGVPSRLSRVFRARLTQLAHLVHPGRWSVAGFRWTCWVAGSGVVVLALLLLPRSPFEYDEVLFLRAMDGFDVARHSPHPPGYPVYIAVAHLIRLILGDPLRSLQLASVLGAVAVLVSTASLARSLGASRGAVLVVGLLTVSIPAFSFHCNVGMSDGLGAGMAAVAVWALVRAIDSPLRPLRLPVAAALSALALGVRPQLVAVLAGVGLWALASAARAKRWRSILLSILTGVTVVAGTWLPVVALTGWSRYRVAVRRQLDWIAQNEFDDHLPLAPLGRLVDHWLVRPLGTEPLAIAFWTLVVVGAVAWVSVGRRRLALAAALSGGGHLVACAFTMSLGTSVRYIVPALPFLALLASGVVVLRWPSIRAVGACTAICLAGLQVVWTAPVLALRAREVAPVWETLTWVRDNLDPEATRVVADRSLIPHARYMLAPAGFRVYTHDDERARTLTGRDVVDVAPLHAMRDRLPLHTAAWRSVRLRELTRNRYYDSGAARRVGVGAP